MLDIIIPAYKDPDGLKTTLESVCYPEYKNWVTITVIDDCSQIKYTELEHRFPNVHFYYLEKNRGPGHARQFGMDHTSEPYLLFLDCGDVMYSKQAFLDLRRALELHPTYYLFLFTWISDSTGKLSTPSHRSTQGWVYKRKFFKLFPIKFCTSSIGGYAHEDVGFNRTCMLINEFLEKHNKQRYFLYSKIIIQKKINNPDSITNTGRYRLYKMIPGFTENGALTIKQLEENRIDSDIILKELNYLILAFYKHFMRCAIEDPSTADSHWKCIRKFYFETYKKYENLEKNKECLKLMIPQHMERLMRYTNKPSIERFIMELNLSPECPEHYYHL